MCKTATHIVDGLQGSCGFTFTAESCKELVAARNQHGTQSDKGSSYRILLMLDCKVTTKESPGNQASIQLCMKQKL